MQSKPHKIDVPKGEPFKYDLLGRKSIAENATNLLTTLDQGTVLGLNGPYGSGKTTFVDMWRGYLSDLSIRSIYFNAWETDYATDPLVPLIAHLRELIDSSGGEDSESAKRYKLVRKNATRILKRGLPFVVKILTQGLLDLKNEDVEAGLAELLQDQTEAAFDNYAREAEEIHAFKTAMQDFVDHIRSTQEESTSESQPPIVFFIDELDRCRPTFAISLLERLKHFFVTDGIVFVFSIDQEQLGHCVKSLYGSKFDSSGYLKRFFDIQLNLPPPDKKTYVRQLFDKYNLRRFLKNKRGIDDVVSELIDVIGSLASNGGLQLRNIEQIIFQLNISLRMLDSSKHIFPNLLAFLIYIRSEQYATYKRIRSDRISGSDLWRLVNDEQRMLDGAGPFSRGSLQSHIMGSLSDGSSFKEYRDQVYGDFTKANSGDSGVSEEEFQYLHGAKTVLRAYGNRSDQDRLSNNLLRNTLDVVELAVALTD